MHAFNYQNTITLFLLLVFVLPWTATAQEVTVHPNPEQPLEKRMDWAKQEAGNTSGYWVGYQITKYMRPNVWMGSIGGKNWQQRTSMYAMLGQADREQELPPELQKELGFSMRGTMHFGKNKQKDDVRVQREVAVLMYMKGRRKAPTDILVTNMSLGVDLEGAPLFWLGAADDEQSVAVLQDVFYNMRSNDLKSDVLGAISVHENKEGHLPFLASVLEDDPSDEVREDAAFWIGQLDIPQSLPLLQQAIANDPSMDVRENAVFALSEMSSSEALDVLIDLAQRGRPEAIRKKAIFWLSQHASKNALHVIEDIVMAEEDIEIQEQAVFALSQFPADESVPRLIEIAENHHNLEVRKKAIFWLGDSGDPRAVDALVSLARKKN